MTARELIQALVKLPMLDVELKIKFSYYTLDGCDNEYTENEDHIVTGVTTDGILKTEIVACKSEYIEYEDPEPPEYDDEEYFDEDAWLEEMQAEEDAWEEHNKAQVNYKGILPYEYPFENDEEQIGYFEYCNTLKRQDEDLAELVEIAKKNALNAELEEMELFWSSLGVLDCEDGDEIVDKLNKLNK